MTTRKNKCEKFQILLDHEKLIKKHQTFEFYRFLIENVKNSDSES
jgi:hypothetical protein